MTEAATETVGLPWEREVRGNGSPDRLARLAEEIIQRCRGEGPANCVARCPLHVDARGYVQLIGEGLYREALQLIRHRLPFPGILGYICTHPCELHCKNIDRESAVRIRDLKRFLAEWEPGEPQHVLDRRPDRSEKVAVVGSGPAGLIAAHDLARQGFQVTLFEREFEIGGCLVHKIPPWRLPRSVVKRDLSIIAALGIRTRTGFQVGRDATLADLRKDHEALLLLCGYQGGLELLRGGGLELGRTIRDTVRADPFTGETGVPGVFAGGEAVSGPGAVIDALALGRSCAKSAYLYLSGRDLHEDRRGPRPRKLLWTLDVEDEERRRRVRTPVMLQPYNEPLDEAEAQEESARCLGCACGWCVDDCEFLAKHCHSPKGLARRVKDGLEDADTLKMAYSCNVCSLCATVCPEGLDTGGLMLEARREAVRRGAGPLPEHKSVVSYFNRGVSRAFTLLMPEPGRGKSKRLFFTGCALPAVSPGNTIRIYDELRRHFRGTGVLMFCCGAPVKLLGMEELFEKTRKRLLQQVEESGAEELVVACPGCTYTLKQHVPELRTTTVWELLADKLEPLRDRQGVEVAIHDSCKARNEPRIQRAIRGLLNVAGCEVDELEYAGALTRCCGAGGRIQPVDPDLSRRIALRRSEESSLPMVTYCAECRMSLADCGQQAIHILDFLFSADWEKTARGKVPGKVLRYANRLGCKASFKRLRPLGAG